MKEKHLRANLRMCQVIATQSSCPRRQFGAMLLDPERNTILGTGYNGGPRGGGRLCGGEVCLREDQQISSGHRVEIGCHHAEMNVLCNAAANGTATQGAWLIVTGEPCQMCAKLIHHCGIVKVIVVVGGYVGQNGVNYLVEHGVKVEYQEGAQDPRGVCDVDPV